jgi:polysaccharide biosynthesis protein PslG
VPSSRAGVLATIALGFCLLTGATASAAGPPLAGVQTHLLWEGVSPAELDHQLDLVKRSGATITRVDVGWASVEQNGPGGFDRWYVDKLDAVVDAANERGIKLLLTFMSTPCWASTAPAAVKQGCAGSWWSRGVSAYTPADPARYADALGRLAARYRGRVTGWEIWNEPNLRDFFKASDPAAAYSALARAAYPAVKAADPDAIVVAGALSQSDYAFTQALYDDGIKGSFDAFSIHPYSEDASPLDPRSGTDKRYSFIRGVPAIRRVMVRNRDAGPIWLTESGWSTAPIRTSDRWRNGVSEAAQARFLTLQMQQAAKWPWVRATIWYDLLDDSGDPGDLAGNYGLRHTDGSAKPAWVRFVKRARAWKRARARQARAARAARRHRR